MRLFNTLQWSETVLTLNSWHIPFENPTFLENDYIIFFVEKKYTQTLNNLRYFCFCILSKVM